MKVKILVREVLDYLERGGSIDDDIKLVVGKPIGFKGNLDWARQSIDGENSCLELRSDAGEYE